jgi:hypothetical protein
MGRLNNLLNTKLNFNRRDLERAGVFALGFLSGSGDPIGAIFFAIFWYAASFIGRKIYAGWRK